MATKKLDLTEEQIGEPVYKPLPILEAIPAPNDLHDFAVAALQSLDWNQIGMGVDQAAQLCWSMAEAMIRNKP